MAVEAASEALKAPLAARVDPELAESEDMTTRMIARCLNVLASFFFNSLRKMREKPTDAG